MTNQQFLNEGGLTLLAHIIAAYQAKIIFLMFS
jgi:hypothetical protein